MGNKSKKSRVQDERHEISSSVSISFFFAFVLELEGQTKKKPFKDGCIQGCSVQCFKRNSTLSRIFAFFLSPVLLFNRKEICAHQGYERLPPILFSNRPCSSFFLSVKSGRKAKKFEIVKACLSGQKKGVKRRTKKAHFFPFLWLGEYSTRV